MSQFIPNLLAKKPEPAVEELRRFQNENDREKKWLIGLRDKATVFRKAVITTRQAMSDDPSDTTVNAFIKAVSDSPLADAYGEAAQYTVTTLTQRKDARTRPVLDAALRAVIARLESEEKEVSRLDARSAEHLDVPVDDAVSPARQRIKDAKREAEAYLQQLPTMPVGSFVHPIRFLLGDEYCQ